MYMQLDQRPVVLGQLMLFLRDYGDTTLLAVKQTSRFTIICTDVKLTDTVDVYKATTSANADLISIGDFVKFTDNGAIEVSRQLLFRLHFITNILMLG